jgi:hypothetical protein
MYDCLFKAYGKKNRNTPIPFPEPNRFTWLTAQHAPCKASSASMQTPAFATAVGAGESSWTHAARRPTDAPQGARPWQVGDAFPRFEEK